MHMQVLRTALLYAKRLDGTPHVPATADLALTLTPALKTIIHQQQLFASGMIDGRTVVNSSRDRQSRRKSPPSGKSSRRMCASTERNKTMARKPAFLKDTLLACKGEASPAHVVTATPAGEELVRLSVKLTSEEYLRLMQLGLQSRPHRTNREILRETVLEYLDAEEEDDGSRGRRTS
jgi:hypothetical protein